MTNSSMIDRLKTLKAEIASIEKSMALHSELGISEVYAKEIKVGMVICRQVLGKSGCTLASKPFPKFHEKWKVLSVKKEKFVGGYSQYTFEMRKVGSHAVRYMLQSRNNVLTIQSV